MRSTAVSSVCASERRAIASPTTSSSARVRPSSSSTWLACSPARRACAARVAKAASAGSSCVGRHRLFEEIELEDAERGLAERDRRGTRRVAGEIRVLLDRDRPPGAEELANEPGSGFETAFRARGGEQLDLPRRRRAPERPALRAGRLDRGPHGLLGDPAGVAAGGEGVAGELEPRAAATCEIRARLGAEHADCERELRGCELGERELAVVERLGDADQLERPEHAVTGAAGDERDRARSVDARRCALERLRDGAGREHVAGHPRAGDLGAERGALRGDRPRGEVAGAVEDAHDRQVGAARLGGCTRERRQGAAQVRRGADLGGGAGERFDGQAPGVDNHHLQYCLDYNPPMAEPARKPVLSEDAPSLDPLAIERAYRRERARRRAKVERRSAVRRSDVRFWVTLLVLAFFAAFVILAAWHEVQTLFGV